MKHLITILFFSLAFAATAQFEPPVDTLTSSVIQQEIHLEFRAALWGKTIQTPSAFFQEAQRISFAQLQLNYQRQSWRYKLALEMHHLKSYQLANDELGRIKDDHFVMDEYAGEVFYNNLSLGVGYAIEKGDFQFEPELGLGVSVKVNASSNGYFWKEKGSHTTLERQLIPLDDEIVLSPLVRAGFKVSRRMSKNSRLYLFTQFSAQEIELEYNEITYTSGVREEMKRVREKINVSSLFIGVGLKVNLGILVEHFQE